MARTYFFSNLLAAPLLLALPNMALAQNGETQGAHAIDPATALRSSENAAPPNGETTGNQAPVVHVTASQGEATVDLAVGYGKTTFNPVNGQFNAFNFKIGASAKAGEDDRTSIFDFNRLSDGTEITAGFSIYFGKIHVRNPSSPGSRSDQLNGAIEKCVGAAERDWRKAYPANDKIAQSDSWMGDFRSRSGTAQLFFQSNGKADTKWPDFGPHVGKYCAFDAGDGTPSQDEFVLTYGDPSQFDDYLWQAQGGGTGYLGANFKIAPASYKFADSSAFKVDDTSRTAWSVTGYGGWIRGDGNLAITGSVGWERKFKSPDDITYCRPSTITTQSECITGPNGLPEKSSGWKGAGEIRWQTSVLGQPIGFAPRVDYSFKQKDALISLPVYVAPNKEGQLTGGIKFGYATKDDDFGAELFIGIPFAIFK
jgi:hypothetical protein